MNKTVAFLMKAKIMDKNELQDFVDELTKDYKVFAPVKMNRIFRLKEISKGKEACLGYQNTRQPPKEIFFPQTEILFTYKMDKEGVELEDIPLPNEKRVLFGIRPCDARALVFLDRFFSSGDYKDISYLEKREKTTIIGLACNSPLSTCFCTSLGGSPFGKEGMDLLLEDINEKYLIEILSEQGAKLVEHIPWLKDAENADFERAKKISEEAESTIKLKIAVEGLRKKFDSMFDAPLWDQIYQKCIGCGVCTYLCPTCWCFDILDEGTPTCGRRVRIWDTCQFPLFTLEASGLNPRPSGKERMRQRVMHKFNYFPKDFGELVCVGCGRCVQACPVNLDIREIIKAIMNT